MSLACARRTAHADRAGRLRACIAVVLAIALGACAAVPRRVPAVSPGIGPGEAEAALAALAQAAEARRGLRGTLRLSLDGPEGSFRSTQVLLLERPSRLRVEVLGFLSQTVAVLTTDGERFDLFRASERRLERGPVYPGLLHDVARIDLEPDEAVAVLLGVPRMPPGLHVARVDATEEGGIALDLVDAPGALRRRVELGPGSELRAAEVRTLGGTVLWRARFDDYRDVAGASFAHRVELRFPDSNTDVEVAFTSVELNPDLSDEAFVLVLPDANEGSR